MNCEQSTHAFGHWGESYCTQWVNECGYLANPGTENLSSIAWSDSPPLASGCHAQAYMPVVLTPVCVNWSHGLATVYMDPQSQTYLLNSAPTTPLPPQETNACDCVNSMASPPLQQDSMTFDEANTRWYGADRYRSVPQSNAHQDDEDWQEDHHSCCASDDEDAQSDIFERGSCASTRASTLPEQVNSSRQRKRRAARRRGVAPLVADAHQCEIHIALRADLDAGEEERQSALLQIRGSVWRFAREAEGCRTVQHAFHSVDKRQLHELVHELHGHVKEAIPSPHANYVIAKVIELVPIPQLDFIITELAGAAACTSRHRFGCRIICRLLEHAACDGRTQTLVEELVSETASLSRHVFGHHVMRALLEHASGDVQQRLVLHLRQDLLRNAMNRSASYVVERALQQSPEDTSTDLANDLLSMPIGVYSLAQNQYGCYVVKALLRLQGQQASNAMEQLQAAAPRLREHKYGRRLLHDLGLISSGG